MMISEILWSMALGGAVASVCMAQDTYRGNEGETLDYIITGALCSVVSLVLRVVLPL